MLAENNSVHIVGAIVSDFRFSHEIYGEKFYLTDISVERLSGINDVIPILVSDRIMDVSKDYRGQLIEVSGQFRSFMKSSTPGNKLCLFVFVQDWKFAEDASASKSNEIYLEGFICKVPTYRKTPFEREISDILVAVNRPYGKADYIPCIAWGRNARFVAGLDIGNKIKVWGRVQSRIYTKKLDDEKVEKRIAYEVSVSRIDIIEE